MKFSILIRLLIYFATITLVVGLIGWFAHVSWQRAGDVQEQLSAKQWESFQIADRLQQGILNLNILMLRYGAERDDSFWTNFVTTSGKLGDWFSEQRQWFNAQQEFLQSETEKSCWDQLNTAYSDYLTAAYKIHRKIYGTKQYSIRVKEFADLEACSERILNLGIHLSSAHQEWINNAQQASQSSLNILRWELLGSQGVLLVGVLWLALVAYRDLISPLQVQLVESRQIVERQEKLASLGMLAAGVAHEIRNPLTAIKAWLFLQQKHLKPGTPEYSDAELIGQEINRLERIVKDFLQFARPSDPQFAMIPAEQPLQEVKTLMQPTLEKSGIKIEVNEVVSDQICVDSQQIKQVLINLVQNGADSIGRNGTIKLRARRDEKRLEQRQTDVVILEVEDTGGGIPPEAEKRLFDPFFTTKDFGTGLGLPIAARIVEKNHGVLQYQTEPGHGTTFGIILPLNHKS